MTYLISRIILFGLILTLGALTALRVGETASLTSTALHQTAVEALAANRPRSPLKLFGRKTWLKLS
jgi:hypothetical protein